MIKKWAKQFGWSMMVGGMVFLTMVYFSMGCSGRALGYPTFSKDIQSPDPSVRIKAVIYAGNSGDKRAIPLLVDRLEDDDEVVRLAAIESLKQLTKQDFGYRSYDPPYKRLIAVEQWRKWLTAGQPPLEKNKSNPKKGERN